MYAFLLSEKNYSPNFPFPESALPTHRDTKISMFRLGLLRQTSTPTNPCRVFNVELVALEVGANVAIQFNFEPYNYD